MTKQLYENTVLDNDNGKVKFYDWPEGFNDLKSYQVLAVTNVTDNEIIYLPQISGKGGTVVSGTGDSDFDLILDYDVTTYSGSKEIQTFVDFFEISDHFPLGNEETKSINFSNNSLCSFFIDTHIISEYVALNTDLIGTLDVGDKCLQVFRASSNNVYETCVILNSEQTVSGTSIIDDFNSYQNDSDLLEVWSQNESGVIVLESSITYEGANSILFKIQSVGDWAKYIFDSNQDWSIYDSVLFYHKTKKIEGGNSFYFRIKDSDGNTMYKSISAGQSLSWNNESLLFSDFTIDSSPLSMDSISSIELLVENVGNSTAEYIDFIVVYQTGPSAAKAKMQFYHFGDSMPASGTSLPTPLLFSSGSNYTEETVPNQMSLLKFSTVLGYNKFMSTATEDETLLTVGDYYGISIENISTCCAVNVYGMNTSYENKSFYTTVSGGYLEGRIDSNAGFYLLSRTDSYISKCRLVFNDNPGEGTALCLVSCNTAYNKTGNLIGKYEFSDNQTELEVCFKSIIQPLFISDDYCIKGFLQPNTNTVADTLYVTTTSWHKKHESYS